MQVESLFDIPWMKIAIQEVGQKEIPGSDNNPRILEYMSTVQWNPGISAASVKEDISWCSCFANWCMKSAGFSGTGSPVARSWLKYGEQLLEPKKGAIVIIQRGKESWQGHVGFIYSWTDTHIQILGGNQGNMVNISSYMRNKILGIRWPIA